MNRGFDVKPALRPFLNAVVVFSAISACSALIVVMDQREASGRACAMASDAQLVPAAEIH
jgi:hypothetical protein